MQISTVLVIAAGLPVLAGIGRTSLENAGLKKKHVMFFLLCVLLLKGFILRPAEDIEISAGSLVISAWLFGNVLNSKRFAVKAVGLIPLSLTLGYLLRNAVCLGEEDLTVLFPCAIPVLFLLFTGEPDISLALNALIPVFACVSRYVDGMLTDGYGSLVITENCLISQLIGIMTTGAALILLKSIRTTVRSKSYERTT